MQDFKDDFDSLVARTPLSEGMGRRAFVKTALGSGFAAAVLPVCAQSAIKTDSAGLSEGTVHIKVNGQDVPVYHAQPQGKDKLPVILVVSEIFGVHEHIADVARRFAKIGYLAVAPDLFVRQGDPTKISSISELMSKVISKVPDQQVMGDLDACAAWAKSHGGDTTRLGITGFCWGGRITWLYAAHNPEVKAGVAWYGRLVGQHSTLNPRQPIDIAPKLTVPVLGLYGGKDEGIPLDSVEAMKKELARGSSKSEFVVFPDAGHAFNADYRPSYREAAAKEGWQRCIDWFKTHGVA